MDPSACLVVDQVAFHLGGPEDLGDLGDSDDLDDPGVPYLKQSMYTVLSKETLFATTVYCVYMYIQIFESSFKLDIT